jgi:hypothetical protein
MVTLPAAVRLHTKLELQSHSGKLSDSVWTDPPEPATTMCTCTLKQRTFFALTRNRSQNLNLPALNVYPNVTSQKSV